MYYADMAENARYGSTTAAYPSRAPAAWKSPRNKPIELMWRGIAARVRDVHDNPFFEIDKTLSAPTAAMTTTNCLGSSPKPNVASVNDRY